MVAYAGQPTGDAAHLAELREAGAYRDGRLHPTLEEGLDAVLNPVCRLEVRLAGAHGRDDRCHGWVAGGAAGLLLPDREGLCEFVVVHPGFVPERLARVVGLGPRPRTQAAGPLELGTGLLDELTAADPGRRTGALQRVLDGPPGPAGAVARALATGFRARWEAVMRWLPAPGSAGQRSVQVADTESTLWAVERAGIGLALSPTTPTAVWRRFVTLLPNADELA